MICLYVNFLQEHLHHQQRHYLHQQQQQVWKQAISLAETVLSPL